jgi:Fe-S cluster assembly iron-binding protein IscA
MLQIDDDAAAALADVGPLRITAEEVDGDIEVGLDEAEGPEEGDEIVERDGARVFLDALAAEVLADQVLGVHAHGDHFHFTFDDQAGASSS